MHGKGQHPLDRLISMKYIQDQNQILLNQRAITTQLQFYLMSNSQVPLLFLHQHPHSLQSYHELEMARQRIDPHKQRITQTNMVYMIGIPQWLANQETLKSYEYCGQYGDIIKTMIKKTYFNQFASYSAYVTYSSDEAACLAVLGINNLVFERNRIYASYGTNKYCAQYVKFGKCRKEECPFIHEIAVHKEIYQDDNKKIFQGQQDLARSYFIANHQRMFFDKTAKCIFPTSAQILESFVKSGYIASEPARATEIYESSEEPKGIDRKSSTSTLSSPSKQSFDEKTECVSIEERILLQLSARKSSLFRFARWEQIESQRVESLLRRQIQSTFVLSC